MTGLTATGTDTARQVGWADADERTADLGNDQDGPRVEEWRWEDISEVPDRFLPRAETTAEEVFLWQDNGGGLYVESSGCPLVVGGLEAVVQGSFREDAAEWPHWVQHSMGVHFITREAFLEWTDAPEFHRVASYRNGTVNIGDEVDLGGAAPGGNARYYLGLDYNEDETGDAFPAR